jgi:tetratricopeptide (TPR) repeat protein
MTKKCDFLGGQIPIVMKDTKEGKLELSKKLSSLNLERYMAEIYEKHLGIDLNSHNLTYKKSFEDIGLEFIEAMAEEDWDNVPTYFDHKEKLTAYTIVKRLRHKKEINELSYFSVMASGISQDGKSAFSSFEIDYKYDMSVIYVYKGDWKVENIIFSDINLIYSEEENIKHIASAFVQKDYQRAWQLITQAEEIYYLSPDVQYYKGLYYSINGNPKEALVYFKEASDLDVTFAEAIFNQAFIHHSQNSLEEAKKLYEKTVALQPSNVNALNNLGTIYLAEKDYQAARSCFQKCVEIAPDFKFAIENLKQTEEYSN